MSSLNLASLNYSEKLELADLLAEKDRRKRTNRLAEYKPYPKQREFHEAGAKFRERLLLAANQVGKTLSAGFEVAMHLTGRYPPDWQGRRFDHPIVAWVASETMEVSRDASQRILLGRAEERGTGAIPGDLILELAAYPNVKDAVSVAKVRHTSGGVSIVVFKSYDQGRKKFQGDSIDLFWPDEEPPESIYTEGLTRTNATGGMVMMTFTPLLGMSDVVKRFLMESSADRHVTKMTIDDALHYTKEERERIVASYPEHEREARAKGIPVLGSGRVFPVAEATLQYEGMQIASHWPRIAGIDFGWDHPAACAWMAWDRDADCVYVYDAYRAREKTPAEQSLAIRARGDWIPVAWPHDGLQHDKGSGEQLAEQYRGHGVSMLPKRATFEDGTNGVEAGVMDMLDRMKTGRLKVSKHLNDWWEEFRMYHRKDGQIVKKDDDLLSATRYGMMMLRFAITKPTAITNFDFPSQW